MRATAEERSEPERFVGWWIVAGAFTIYFVGGGLFNTATVYFKAVAAELGLNRGQLSGAFSLGFLVAGLSAPLWGRIADRRGPRAAFLPGVLLTGVLCMLLGRIWDLASLYVFYLLFTLGTAGISLIPVSVVVSNWFEKKRGRAMGLAYMGEGFGALVMTPVSALLIASVGWRFAYVLSGLAVLVVLTPVVFFMRNRPQDLGLWPDGAEQPLAGGGGENGDTAEHGGSRGFSRAEAMSTAAFWLVAVTWMVAMMPLVAVTLHQVPFMTDLGMSMRSAALVAGAVGGMGMVGRVGFGLLSERYPVWAIYACCYLMMALGIALLWSTSEFGMIGLPLYVAFFGIAVGGAFALAGLLVADLFGVRAMGEIFGLLGLVATVGGAVGGTGAGLVFDRMGDYDPVFAICIALSLLATMLMLFVRRPTFMKPSIPFPER
ncbi:MAG: MFS transporter [Candidatus Binatia bacterium]